MTQNSFHQTEPVPVEKGSTFNEEDARRAIQCTWGKDLELHLLHPVSICLFLKETNALGNIDPHWVMKSILGKTTLESVSLKELKLFFEEGRVKPFSLLYKPFIRPADIPHSNRLKKGVLGTSTNHPISPAIAESIVHALTLRLASGISPLEGNGINLRVMGKYTGGLVLGSLAALDLNIPFVCLTKRPYNFVVPPQIHVVKVPEPHMPKDNPEYYSYATLPPTSDILFIDDEATTGEVVKNTAETLQKELGVHVLGVGVVLQSSPEAEQRFKDMAIPYAYLDNLDSSVLQKSETSDNPLLVPFDNTVPLASVTTLPPGNAPKDITITTYEMTDESKHAPGLHKSFFIDHPFRGVTMELTPALMRHTGAKIADEIRKMVGDIGKARQRYYQRGNILFLVGTTPSGVLAAIPASLETRLPLIGAANRPEPKAFDTLGMSDVVNYIHPDGSAYSIFGLTQGDGVVLVTGELTDGEEQLRIITALQQKGIDVLSSISVVENTRYYGREKLSRTAVPVSSLKQCAVPENVRVLNNTANVLDAIKYAVMRLDEAVRKAHPGAFVKYVRSSPSSLTHGCMLKNSDLDETYIMVDGISQHDLVRFQPAFNEWLSVGGFAFDNEVSKAPLLLSLWHEQQNVKAQGLDTFPGVIIYRDGRFFSSDEIIADKTKGTSDLLYKHIARIKWMLSRGEIGTSFVRLLLSRPEVEDIWFPEHVEVLRSLIENLPQDVLSDRALQWVEFLDNLYTAGDRFLSVIADRRESFADALVELAEKDMVRIYGNKLLLLWRHNTSRFSDNFWKNQITFPDNTDRAILRKVYERWRAHNDTYRVAAGDPRFIREKWSRKTSQLAMEFAIRSFNNAGPLSADQKARMVDALGCGNAFVHAALLELADGREQELKSFFQRTLADSLIHPENFDGPSLELFDNYQACIHMLSRFLFRWIQHNKKALDADVRFLLSTILSARYQRNIHHMVEQRFSDHLAEIYKFIPDASLRKQVIEHLDDQTNDYHYRSQERAHMALKKIRGLFPQDFPDVAAPRYQEAAEVLKNEERERLFASFEVLRKDGKPIQTLISDWDRTLIGNPYRSDTELNREIAFWLNWLMQKGKNIVITTGASYERFYRQAIDPAKNQLPLAFSERLNVFNDTVGYLNDRPLLLTPFSERFVAAALHIFQQKGWRFNDDGRVPRMMFIKEGIKEEMALRDARAVRDVLDKDTVYHVTLSPAQRPDRWYIMLYYATKANVFKTVLNNGLRIDPLSTVVIGDDIKEMGNDESLFNVPGPLMKINVGPAANRADCIELQTKEDHGTLLAIEALVASTLLESACTSTKVEDLIVSLDNFFHSAPALDNATVCRMRTHVLQLLNKALASFSMSLASRGDKAMPQTSTLEANPRQLRPGLRERGGQRLREE